MPSAALRYSDWILRALLVVLFAVAGIMKLIAHPFEVHGFARFGYDSWFMYAIGIIELGAALALLHARSLLPAVALLGTVLVGAVYSHWRVGDPPVMTLPALIVLALLAALAAIHWPRGAQRQHA